MNAQTLSKLNLGSCSAGRCMLKTAIFHFISDPVRLLHHFGSFRRATVRNVRCFETVTASVGFCSDVPIPESFHRLKFHWKMTISLAIATYQIETRHFQASPMHYRRYHSLRQIR